MLSIRMQRRGRKGHATYRIVVQDSRQAPTSGKVVAHLGHYDPHAKTNSLLKDKAQFYLDHGAQPTDRVVVLFKNEGIKLPDWVQTSARQQRTTRNPDKLRKNRPAEEAPAVEEPATESEAPEEAPAEATEAEADAPATDSEAKEVSDSEEKSA